MDGRRRQHLPAHRQADAGAGPDRDTAADRGRARRHYGPRSHPPMTTALLAYGRAALVRRGRALEYFTVGYNVAEGLTSLLAAWLAGSIALLGFGIDSVIEVSAGLILIWRLRADADVLRRERVEQRARKLI